MGWLDRVTDSLGLGADSRARQYTRAGAAAGLPGMLGGYIVGRIMDGRSNGADVAAAQTGQRTNLDAFGDRLNAASGAWNVNLGDPQSAGVRAGPPSDLAGGALLSSGQQPRAARRRGTTMYRWARPIRSASCRTTAATRTATAA
jgi:hypothetical protein